MCFHSHISKKAQELASRFKANFKEANAFTPQIYNGFTHPKTPIITNLNPKEIQLFQWGLIPKWAKDESIQKNTLNARVETINEKPSFKNSIQNRCLIISNGFFEWKWLDEKGKNKEKYHIHLADDKTFCFAGIWNEWANPNTGEIKNTYTILTTQANELMSEIHNTKKRMPIIIPPKLEENWLLGKDLGEYNVKLIGELIS